MLKTAWQESVYSEVPLHSDKGKFSRVIFVLIIHRKTQYLITLFHGAVLNYYLSTVVHDAA